MPENNSNEQGDDSIFTRETIGAILLLLATAAALILANTEIGDEYTELLKKELSIGFINELTFKLTVKNWINDGLMTIFFFVVGLEIKRELLVGELSSKKDAAMPMIAALGGMALPAIIFIILNLQSKASNGWAIPMATDIAYAVGILGLLRTTVPTQLKVLLTGLAIADDIGAIVVIAAFYSSDIEWLRIGIAGGIFIILILINIFGIKKPFIYLILGVALWICFVHSGIHPTIAGVLFALTIPVRPPTNTSEFQQKADNRINEFKEVNFEELDPFSKKEQRKVLEEIKEGYESAYPLLLRMENSLQAVTSYFIMPVFALANAGVKFNIPFTEIMTATLSLGIILGLVFGKVTGIVGFAFLSYKLNIAKLPKNVNWKHVIGMGFLAGIGFTLSLFITNLAFTKESLVQMSKISASPLSGI